MAGEGGPRRCPSSVLDNSGIQLRAARTLVIRLYIIRLRDCDRKGQECSSVPFRSFLASARTSIPWSMPTEGISLDRHRTDTMLSSAKVHAWMVSVGNAAHQPQSGGTFQ